MKKTCIAVFSLILVMIGCSKEEIRINPDNLLIGTWNYSDYQDNTSVFSRDDHFIDNHCYRFNNDGTMTERENAGWCGTPPVTYADYPGTWSMLNDTLVQIEVGYWGGTTSYKLDIEKIDTKTLKASFVYEETSSLTEATGL